MAATLAVPSAIDDAQLNVQVHGGIGFTWEHDAHLYVRRAYAIGAYIDVEAAAVEVTERLRAGTRLDRSVDLPPEADLYRGQVQEFVGEVAELDPPRAHLAGWWLRDMPCPHWPEPWGRAAGAVEQLVIEEELGAAGIKRPSYSITGWVILTLVQHGTDDQVARWVRPALDQQVVWCQLFSEPDAGSGRCRRQDQGQQGGRWLADQRPEGVDERSPCSQLRAGHGADQPRRGEARRHQPRW